MRRIFALAAIIAALVSVSARAANIGPISGPLTFNGTVFTYTAGVIGMVGSGAITLNAGAGTGLTAPGAMSLGGTYTFGATTDTPRFAGLGLGGPAIGANELSIYGGTSGRLILAVPAAAGTNTLTLPAGTTDLSSTGPGVLQQSGAGAAITVGTVANSLLANSATTVNGQSCALGASCTITASAGTITVGTTTVASGTTKGLLYNNAGVLGNLATANSGLLVTDGSGNPSISTAIPTGVTATSFTIGGATGTTSSGDVNISGSFKINGTPYVTSTGTVTLNTSSLIETLPNSATGTTNNKLVIDSGGQAQTATTAQGSQIIGICQNGITGTSCGTTGNASIAIAGQATCAFDGSTTAGDFITASGTVAGDCTDVGSTIPQTAFVLGNVLTTNVGAGAYAVDISPIGPMAALNKKSSPGGTNGQLQYNNNGAFGGLTLMAGTNITVTSGAGSLSVGETNNSTTVNGQSCVLGSSCTITATAGTITIGTTSIASGGTGGVLYETGGNLLGESAALTSGQAVVGGGAGSAPHVLNAGANTGTYFGASGALSNTGTNYADGKVLIGTTGGNPTVAALTAGTGIGITNGPGSITVSANAATTGAAGIALLQQSERSIGWLAGVNPNNATIFIAANALTVQSIVGNPETALGATGTADVYDAASGTACGSGTKVTTSSFNANGTAATNQSLLSAPYSLSSGHRLCLQTTGTNWATGSSVAAISVAANP